MSKYRLDNPAGTKLDPFAFEKQFAQPDTYNSNPFSGISPEAEVFANKVDDGYGTMGDSSFAQQAINERKASDQSSLDLLGHGIYNVARTIGIEIAKTPGYAAGIAGAIANETLGDGKNSMSMIVDNAWVNAFEGLDDNLRAALPTYMHKEVSEGNLLDKMGSGAWWATTGADGLGFMLSMFAPGMALKAAGVGTGIAKVGEAVGNLSPRLGRMMTSANMLEKVGDASFKLTKDFARNAGGYASAVLNTTLESSAEAANTFDNVKDKYIQDGLSEEEAKAKAGEAASAVFKGNMALLLVSNILDEKWLWKSIGSAGEKEAGKSMISKILKDGVPDPEMLAKVAKEFTKKEVLKKVGKNFGKNTLKEGFYEEGSQTTLQQNVEDGKIEDSFLDNLSNVATSYFDDFLNNDELHEAIFLGGLLGGGASVIQTVQDNQALKASLYGSKARTKDNSFWAKYGVLPETKDQKGLIKLVEENHISQFRSYKDFITKNPQGESVINEKKLIDANLEKVDNLRTDIMYDIAVAEGDELTKEIYGQFLAASYAQSFLGQEGGLELFQAHVKDQVLPAWEKRFEETFDRPATSKEKADYQRSFTQSGERVIDAYSQAEQTNYPERYFHEATQEYQDFKDQYFHQKFQTLVALDSVKERKSQITQELTKRGISEGQLEDLGKIADPFNRLHARQYKEELDRANKLEEALNLKYTKFFNKEGVKEMYDEFTAGNKRFEEAVEKEVVENEELRKKVDALPSTNQETIDKLVEGIDPSDENLIPLVDKDGKKYTLTFSEKNGKWNLQNEKGNVDVDKFKGDLSKLGLTYDDVNSVDYNEFKSTGKVPNSVLKQIAEKLNNGAKLNTREQEVFDKFQAEVQAIRDDLNTPTEVTTVTAQPVIEDRSAENLDETIDEFESKKKGVHLFPSTGKNAERGLVEHPNQPDLLVEGLNQTASQQLWFKTMEDEVDKDPEAYTVQVVRLDDKSNPELHTQISRDADPGNQKDGDLYVVLHKDGKPVMKGGDKSLNITKKAEIQKRLDAELANLPVEQIGPGHRRITGSAEVMLKYNAEFKALENESAGNYVFTSLWRPENLYPITNTGKPSKAILAEDALIENYLFSIGKASLNVDRISKKDKEFFKTLGIENPTAASILEAAFFHAKKEYTEWYRGLQEKAKSPSKETSKPIDYVDSLEYALKVDDIEKRRSKEKREYINISESKLEEVQELWRKAGEISKKWSGFNVVGIKPESPTLKEMGDAHKIYDSYINQAYELHHRDINAKYDAEIAALSKTEVDVVKLRKAKTKTEATFAILNATKTDNLKDGLQAAENIIGKAMNKADFHSDPVKFANELADAIEKKGAKIANVKQTNPPTLQIVGVTNGHPIKIYDQNKNLVWGKPLIGIPNLKLTDSKVPKPTDLKGGTLKLSITGTIPVNGGELKISAGDLVLVDDKNNIHSMKARNINESEVNTILYLLSLRAIDNQPTETITVTPDVPMRIGVNEFKSVPVFFNNSKKNGTKGESRKNLIETLISFGKKSKDKAVKGEIYFNQQSILDGNPIVVWTDFNGETKNLELKKLKEVIDKNDLSNPVISDLVVFLQQKRFNVNEHLVQGPGANPKFNKPSLKYMVNEKGEKVPTLSWDNSKSYYDHLLNDVLTTTTSQVEGYPKRVQRNAWFEKETVKDNSFEKLVPVKEATKVEKPKKSRVRAVKSESEFMDKVLTTSDLIKVKLQSGELKQNCK